MSKDLIQRNFASLVFEFRGYTVIIDSDLAALFEVETKKLKQQVRRNADRFPADFMFELTADEKQQLILGTERLSNLKFSSVNPMVFTEQGVGMLSSVLTSQQAVQMNIAIMRAFTRYRELLLGNDELRKEIRAVDGKLNEAFQFLAKRIDALHDKKNDRQLIGYTAPKKKKK